MHAQKEHTHQQKLYKVNAEVGVYFVPSETQRRAARWRKAKFF